MRLHRSGTIFLYQCMDRCFPLTLQPPDHLLYYEGLLVARRDGREHERRPGLNAALVALGIEDRKMDNVAVNDKRVEDYCFLLHRLSGRFRITDENARQFDRLCRELVAVQPPAPAVLLNNSWETVNAAFILERFPEARFVYICRGSAGRSRQPAERSVGLPGWPATLHCSR